VVAYPALVDGRLHVFFVNFSGIVPHQKVTPAIESSARIMVPAGGNAALSFLPFLGIERKISGERSGKNLVFHLPPFDRGAVVWLNDSH
jgi:hypothetical protein